MVVVEKRFKLEEIIAFSESARSTTRLNKIKDSSFFILFGVAETISSVILSLFNIEFIKKNLINDHFDITNKDLVKCTTIVIIVLYLEIGKLYDWFIEKEEKVNSKIESINILGSVNTTNI